MAILSLTAITAEDIALNPYMAEPLANAVKLGDFELEAPGDNKKIDFPVMPLKDDMIPVLRFRAASYMPTVCGCNYSIVVTVNGKTLGPITIAKTSRILGKEPVFEFKSIYKGRKFPYFGRKNAEICIPYGPDCDAVDNNSADGVATVLILDVSDVLTLSGSNVLSFRNIRNHIDGIPIKVMVRDCEVGYLSKSQIKKMSVKKGNK